MDEKIAVIGQNPFGALVAFEAGGKIALGLKLQIDFVADGLHLAVVIAGADHEMICKGSDAGEVKNDDVFGLLTLGGPDGEQPVRSFGRRFRTLNLFYFFLRQRLPPKPLSYTTNESFETETAMGGGTVCRCSERPKTDFGRLCAGGPFCLEGAHGDGQDAHAGG